MVILLFYVVLKYALEFLFVKDIEYSLKCNKFGLF